jgi:acyl-CoA synthetase (AMP-forming)/AMP-acid ligase II
MWRLLSDTQARALCSARLLVSGASALPRGTGDRIEALSGHRILNRYAMTETLAITSPRWDLPRETGQVGPPLPGVEVRLRAAGDDFGELDVRGPSLFKGYLNLSPAIDDNGWFATGDLARWDESGSLRLVGRRSTDLIKTAGFRVGAGEVEDALLTHPGVTEAAVVGLPDEILGERVTAWIVADPGIDEKALRRHLAPLLARYKWPTEVRSVDALPRNALGKVQKQLLRLHPIEEGPTP